MDADDKMGFLCVASQTPLIQFAKIPPNLAETNTLDLSSIVEGVDYKFSPGGVSRMLYPLLKHMRENGMIEGVEWISLNPNAPRKISIRGINLNHISLDAEKLMGYGNIKEGIWRLFHGFRSNPSETPDFWQDEYVDFTFLNRKFGELAYTLRRQVDLDGFYIHDFQLLPMGSMLHTPEPKIFRWHIPFREQELPKSWHSFLLRYLNSYDAIIVSCRRYLDGLRSLGYSGPAYHLYPYINPSNYSHPTSEEIQILREKLGLHEEDRVILTVARLDPMKAQDKVIFALKKVLAVFPKTKLILIGNGSFSSSKSGIGLSKAERWLQYLRNCVDKLDLTEHVVFAGYMGDKELCAAYALSDVFVLPSIREGFGLVVVEAWLYKKPVVVSTYAGIADLINEGENGLLFDPRDTDELASKIVMVMRSRGGLADKLGERGFKTSRLCGIDAVIKREIEILSKYIGGITYAAV